MFLVTTALKETIKENQKCSFLGAWCEQDLNEEISEYIWSDKNKVTNAYHQCIKHYNYFLPILVEYLNKEHGLNKDIHFYKIILGNWLMQYIHVHYDRYINILNFYRKNRDFDTYIFDDKDYYIPFYHHEFILLACKNDSYNFQIYSNIIIFLFPKKSFKKIRVTNPIEKNEEIRKSDNIIKKYFYGINAFINKLYKESYVISDNYFGENQFKKMLNVLIKSKFKVVFNDFNFGGIFKRKAKLSSRNKSLEVNSTSIFRKFISSSILKDIPEVYAECFDDFRVHISKNFSTNVKSFYTPLSLQYNDEVKFFLADNYKKINIFAQQHGSAYGVTQDLYREFYEKSISNCFLTAGWTDDESTKFVLPKLDKNKIQREKKNITFLTTFSQKYVYAFIHYPMSSYYRTIFFDRMKVFFTTFSETFYENENMNIKSYPNPYCIDRINKDIIKGNSKINLINNAKMSEIFSSKLIVFDHMGTTMLEAAAMNIPFIVYLDNNIECFRDEAQVVINKLVDCGIIYYEPSAAALFIEQNSKNIEQWWLSHEVQTAVKSFSKTYAHIEENWEDRLVEILEKKS